MGILKKTNHAFLRLFVFLQMALWSLGGMASDAGAAKLSNMADNLTNDAKAFSKTVLWGAMVVGIGLILMGAIKLTKREGEGGLGKALIFIVAGVLAVGIPALITMTGDSLFDNNAIGTGGVGGVSNTIRN